MKLAQLSLLRNFFTEGMKQGWAASKPALDAPHIIPGAKFFEFTRDNYSLLDCYFSVPGSIKSHGSTVIWIDRQPVWIMHYGGWYNEGVISFLKRALMRNYGCNVFWGGRGPQRLEGEDHTFQYLNTVESNDFANFKGSERIISTSELNGGFAGLPFGEYNYFGGLL